MISLSLLLPFIAICIAMETTPGPNMAYIGIVSASQGRRAGFSVVAGVAAGLLIIGLISAFGVGVLIAQSPLAYQALRIAGIIYLLWLAWDTWTPEKPSLDTMQTQRIKFFRRGLITNILNPKAAIFYITILPQFVDINASVMPQSLALTLIFVVVATLIHIALVFLGSSIQPFLQEPRHHMVVRRIFAVLLLAVALWFAWGTGGTL